MIEEEASRRVDVLVARERNLDDREAGTIRRVDSEPVEALEHLVGLSPEVGANRVAAGLVDVEAGKHGRERGDRRRPRVEVGRRRRLEQVLELGRARDERRERRVRLGEAADEHDPVVRLVAVADDAVPAHAVWARLVRVALADHAEPVGVVDIEHGVVPTREPSEVLQFGRVPGHAVDAVHADQARGRAVLAQKLLEVVRILEAEPLHGRPARRRELAPVVDRLVRPVVDEDRPVAGQHGDHGQVDQGDRRNDQRVLAAEELDQPLLNLRIEGGAAEHPRPAWVRPPLVDVLGDGLDDLAIEVEAEVVAGGEIGQPLVADSDHPAVDLVDDGVRHRVGPLELDQLAAGGEPAVDPARRGGRRPRAVRAENAHAPTSTFPPESLGNLMDRSGPCPTAESGVLSRTPSPCPRGGDHERAA